MNTLERPTLKAPAGQTKSFLQLVQVLKEVKYGPTLPSDEKVRLEDLFQTFPTVFAHGSRVLGEIRGFEFDIALNVEPSGVAKLQQKAYPASPQRRQDISKNTDLLLELGIVEKVKTVPKGAVISPVLISYEEDKARLCADLRKLNSHTVTHTHPIPRIDHILSNLAKAKRIATLDCNKGYHQMKCTERASWCLLIVTHEGIFRYLRMPFGHKNAPAYFQQCMDSTFSKEISEGWLTVYIDDIIVASTSDDEHYEHLKQVLEKLKELNITIAAKKCNIGFESTRVLGHVVSGLMITMEDKKVAAILLLPPTTTIKEVQHFLGMSGYYRIYIKDYGIIVIPLTQLTRKGEIFEWNKKNQGAFQNLKHALAAAPSLFQPDFTKTFIVYCDASWVGLGGACHQRLLWQGKIQEVPICFISRALKGGELRYGSPQLECLAVIWALEKLHY